MAKQVVPQEFVSKSGKKDFYSCSKTGCPERATGNVEAKTRKFKTNLNTIKEFCTKHGEELEAYYEEKYGHNN